MSRLVETRAIAQVELKQANWVRDSSKQILPPNRSDNHCSISNQTNCNEQMLLYPLRVDHVQIIQKIISNLVKTRSVSSSVRVLWLTTKKRTILTSASNTIKKRKRTIMAVVMNKHQVKQHKSSSVRTWKLSQGLRRTVSITPNGTTKTYIRYMWNNQEKKNTNA